MRRKCKGVTGGTFEALLKLPLWLMPFLFHCSDWDGPQPAIHYRNSIAHQLQPLLQDIIYVEPQSYLQLNCTTDSNPISTVIWMKSGEQTERIQLTIGLSHSNLQKEKIDDSFNGKYICRAYNSYGAKESSVRVYVTSDWKSKYRYIGQIHNIFLIC